MLLKEAKLLVVGELGTGKSSLVERLTVDRFTREHRASEGIVVHQWPRRIGDEDVFVRVWDFGSQEILNQSYRFFLTNHTLSLLVLDARRDSSHNKEEDWLNTLHAVGEDIPVIVVVNHSDTQPLSPLREEVLKERFPQVVALLKTSCETNEGIEALKATIVAQLEVMVSGSPSAPSHYVALRDALESETRDYLSDADFTRLCVSQGIQTDAQQHEQSLLLTERGHTLHFDSPELYRTHVLRPEWATEAVGAVLRWPDLRSSYKGVLERAHLALCLDAHRYPVETHEFLLALLTKFEIAIPLEATTPSKFLVPQLLSTDEPALPDVRGALRFEYHYDRLPPACLPLFIAKAHRFVEKRTWWRTGVILKRGDNRALVRTDENKQRMELLVTGPEVGRRELLAFLREDLRHVHMSFSETVIDEMIYASDDEKISRQPLLLEDLRQLSNAGETEYAAPGVGRVSLQELLQRYVIPEIPAEEELPAALPVPELTAEERQVEAERLAREQQKQIEEHNARVKQQEKRADKVSVVLEQQAAAYADRWIRLLLAYPLVLLGGMFVAIFALGWRETLPWKRQNLVGLVQNGWHAMAAWTWLIPLVGMIVAIFYGIWTKQNPDSDPLRRRLYESQRRKLFEKNGILR
ncbi:COR domain-containing protein [Armatimonas sp.]|uniref:COR domain-containing protein n=1 Tax=Armatimonas sp. TaxID=1872638 RepID=UPI00286A2D60|nr:COR domain-containing protein [Armatimonas sp.]